MLGSNITPPVFFLPCSIWELVTCNWMPSRHLLSLSFQATMWNLGWEWATNLVLKPQNWFRSSTYSLEGSLNRNNLPFISQHLSVYLGNGELCLTLRVPPAQGSRKSMSLQKNLSSRLHVTPYQLGTVSPIGKSWFLSLVLDSQLAGSYQKYPAWAINVIILLLDPASSGKLLNLSAMLSIFCSEDSSSNNM